MEQRYVHIAYGQYVFYMFLHLKIHEKDSGLHSVVNDKASPGKHFIEYQVSIFSQPPSFLWTLWSKKLRSYNLKTHVIQTNIIVPWEFELPVFYCS